MSIEVRAVVFDFDGLVLDTEVPVYASWCAACEAYGASPPTIEEWSATIGTVDALDMYAWVVERADGPVDADAMDVVRRGYRDALLAQEDTRPGVVSWLAEADDAGIGLAIASSSPREWVAEHLARIGLADRFAFVVTADATLRPKPAPDTYLEACARLGVAPADALAVEDSPHGIAAAKAAGLRCVTVPNALTETLDLSAADVRLDSLADRTLAEVLQQLGAGSL